MDVQLYRKQVSKNMEIMETKERTIITVYAKINAPINQVWKFWTSPEDIVKWNNASIGWHTTRAENDLRAGGKFNYRMEAKDSSSGFNFEGVYTHVEINKKIEYTIGDGRVVKILFAAQDHATGVVETFEAENIHPIELQRGGWQAILDNFKKYVEENEKV
jgi:uncharacterized protein YndB with AHSA1/START domain